ncbi:zinc finger, CCHC-type containing protein [Tanacetum coccineum]
MVVTMKHMASKFAKLEKFEGVEFQKWHKKMHFLLSSMSVVYVLTTPMPEDGGENPTVEQVRKRAKWDNDDYVYKGLILNDFKHTLKHLKEELILVELGSHLRIEEPIRSQDNDKPKGNNVAGPSVVNMVEHNNSSRYNDNKGKRKHHYTKADPNKKPKVTCWKCEKPEHLKKDCKAGNIGNKSNGSDTKGFSRWFFQLTERLNIVSDNIGSAFMSTSKLNDLILWHARLGHVHFKRMQDMSKDGLILAFDMDTKKTEDSGGSVVPEKVTEEVVQQPEHKLRKSKRHRTPKDFGPEFQFYLIKGTRDEVSDQHSYCFNVEDDPKIFDEVMKSRDVAFWKEAINDEMDSIMGNNTWVLADLPPGYRPVGCKWIFKRKLKVDGTVEKFKARLFIQGFKQKSGINYFDTYTPVARISTIRLLIAMTVIHNMIIHQMDVKTTFLNGELDEEVYINQPHGFIMSSNENKLTNMYIANLMNLVKESSFACDDMLIFGTNHVHVDLTKKFLSSRFSMNDMGEADVILGIRIKHESNSIIISQSHYIEKVLKKFNYFDCTLVSTPMDASEKLMPNNGQAVSQLEYSRVISCLMYAMTCTRPDIAFDVGKLSRYTSNHGTQHWQAIQRVLKYLKKTMNYRLIYTGYTSVLEGYTYASWISNTKDNSSTSGWVFLLYGGAISWAS